MKTRIAVAGVAVLSLIGLYTSNVLGVQPSKTEPLPNYDKRLEVPQQQRAANAAHNNNAEAALKSVAPGVRVSHDTILGSPSFVNAPNGFLTGPGGRGKAVSDAQLEAVDPADPHRVVKAFLNQHSALFGYDAGVLSGTKIKRDYVTAHNGLHTTVWEQNVDGIPVFDALLVAHVTKDGELVSVSSHFVPDAAKAATSGNPNRNALIRTPAVSSAKAVSAAATNIRVNVPENAVKLVQNSPGAEQLQTMTADGLFGSTSAQLTWLPMDQQSMRLCWRVILGSQATLEQFLVLVDVETGEVLVRRGLTEHITPASYNVYTSDSPSPFSPGWPAPNNTQPATNNRTLVTLRALSTNASPSGWVAEGIAPQTSGNNVKAFLCRNLNQDVNGNPIPDRALPQSDTNRVFDFSLSLTNDPLVYANASIVNFFYRANWYHDRLYDLGFTEDAGNFQLTNFGRGGFGNDNVLALVQAGANVGFSDNANFSTPPDGFNGICQMYIWDGSAPQRDGSLDSEVICHELTHGTSGRLVGGGNGIFALQTEGMGEGWSDFYALCLLSEPSDDVNAAYAMGGYVTYLPLFGFDKNYYFGIRRYPYSTDMSKNPQTFKDIDPSKASAHIGIPTNPLFGGGDPSEPHNSGEIWCMTLREVWANLVTKYGWTNGNQLTLQLVTDAMKLSPVNPTFLEERDAIILADQIDNTGVNFAEIWQGFAKRGMGYGAICPVSDTTAGVTESYDLPPSLTPDGILEIVVNPPPGDILFAGDTNTILVAVSDGLAVKNATVTGSIVGSTNLTFRNDGVAPDQIASNSIYSGLMRVPTGQTNITIILVISAPGKTTTTNTVSYLIFTPPPNDNFANAAKVPVIGTNYFTSNKRATKETGELDHGNISSSTASLWWNYTPASNTNLLIDCAGSTFRGIIGVYTNNSLLTLSNVASAVGSFIRLGPSVNVSVKAGVTYHIAIAGYDSKSLGIVNLNIVPGAQADTNAPTVTINSPADGSIVSTNRILVSGNAVDPNPNPSGIKSVIINVSSSLDGTTTTTEVPLFSSLILSSNWSSLVGLTPGQNTIDVSSIDNAGNRSLPVSIQVTYRALDPINDFFVNAISLTSTSGVSSVNTTGATKEPGEPNHAGSVGGKSAWWNFTAPSDGTLSLSTSNSTFDTVMGVYSGSSVGSLTTVASNDDAPGGTGGFSQITMGVLANQTYRIAVDGYDGLSGVVFLSYSFATSQVYHVTVNSAVGGSATPSSANVQSNGTLIVSATPDPNYQFDLWDGDVTSLANPLSFTVTRDMTITAHFRPIDFTDGFETGNFLRVPWVAGGNKPWIVQTNTVAIGRFAAKSGTIPNNQESSLILSGNFHDGNGSFDYRVSSEPGFDQLRFYIDGLLQQQWSGEAGWANYPFTLTAGSHTLQWVYSKDANGTAGLDAAFIDDVNVPLVIATDASSPANLLMRRQLDGPLFLDLTGQTNQTYIVQNSTNLVSWQNLSTNVAFGGLIRITDLGENTNHTQFYRAVVAP